MNDFIYHIVRLKKKASQNVLDDDVAVWDFAMMQFAHSFLSQQCGAVIILIGWMHFSSRWLPSVNPNKIGGESTQWLKI